MLRWPTSWSHPDPFAERKILIPQIDHIVWYQGTNLLFMRSPSKGIQPLSRCSAFERTLSFSGYPLKLTREIHRMSRYPQNLWISEKEMSYRVGHSSCAGSRRLWLYLFQISRAHLATGDRFTAFCIAFRLYLREIYSAAFMVHNYFHYTSNRKQEQTPSFAQLSGAHRPSLQQGHSHP